MPPRNTNDAFLDRFLGVFGVRRPKKRRKTVSKRKKSDFSDDYNNSDVSINDNFQIVREDAQSKKVEEIRSNRAKNSDNKFQDISSKSVDNNKKPKKKRPVLMGFVSVFLVFVITCCIVVGAALIYLFAFVDDNIDADLYDLKLEYTSILYAKDKEGNDVELKRLHGEQNRLWVDYKDIPENVNYAFISCEDKRFEKHSGVDWKRTFFAFANEVFGLRDNRQGGSTITQQLVKNLTKDDDINATRKIREIMRARKLEQIYDKDTILECYLNTIHLGNGVDGVEVASNYYFDKHVSDISLTQAACLAAITNNPSINEPYNNPENNKTRRNWVIDEMYNNGYISKEECEKAKNADLGLRENPSTILSSTETVEKEEYNSYFVDAVIDDVIAGLVEEKGYTEEYATSQLYKGGYKIYTTIDLDMQEILEEVYLNDDNFMKVYTKSGKQPQSAMTIMDYNGNVKAIIGGRGEKKGNRVLNRATQSPRPTGSSIKPISVYAPAFEYNVITWGSAVEDSPVERLENGNVPEEKWPKNYNNTYSYNKTSMLKAIQQSLNTVPVKLVQEMTIDTTYKFVTEKMGLKHFTEYENGQSDKTESSLALGGSVHGATTLEMAAAFSTFGSGGVYYNPRTYSKILDQNNEVVIDNTKKQHRAISEGTATIMNKLLQTVATNGTGTSSRFGNWQIMCKTGTTSNNKDRWFVGGTPHYVAACWFGVDENEEMSGMYANPAIILWKAAMSKIHENLEYKEFEVSDKVQFKRFCMTSGLCSRSGCSSNAYGYFKTNYMPYCNYHGGYETGEAVDYGYYGGLEYGATTTTTTEAITETTKKGKKTTAVDNTDASIDDNNNNTNTSASVTNSNGESNSQSNTAENTKVVDSNLSDNKKTDKTKKTKKNS